MSGPFHPETIATSRAHERRQPGTCAADDRQAPGPCDCRPDPDDLADVWAGRARMAEPDQFDRHTALGDARWARAIYDAVLGAPTEGATT